MPHHDRVPEASRVLAIAARLAVAALVLLGLAPLAMAGANVWIVDPMGGGDYTTIQSAIDGAFEGDTIYVLPGLYEDSVAVADMMTCDDTLSVLTSVFLETFNDLFIQATGGPDSTIILAPYNGGGYDLSSAVASRMTGGNVVLDGFRLSGYQPGPIAPLPDSFHEHARGGGPGLGHGVIFGYSSYLIVQNCLIAGCSGDKGGGMVSTCAFPTIRNNLVYQNHANTGGGGLWVEGLFSDFSSPVWGNVFWGNGGGGGTIQFSNVTPYDAPVYIVQNDILGNQGTGILDASTHRGGSHLTAYGNIIAWNGGAGIDASGAASVTLDCNDVWQNQGGGYVGVSAGANDVSADPLFCDQENLDFQLADVSPLVNASPCSTIGAYGVGCVLPLMTANGARVVADSAAMAWDPSAQLFSIGTESIVADGRSVRWHFEYFEDTSFRTFEALVQNFEVTSTDTCHDHCSNEPLVDIGTVLDSDAIWALADTAGLGDYLTAYPDASVQAFCGAFGVGPASIAPTWILFAVSDAAPSLFAALFNAPDGTLLGISRDDFGLTGTMKQWLAAASDTAALWAGDAEFVGAKPWFTVPVDSTGETTAWIYLFYSSGKDSTRMFAIGDSTRVTQALLGNEFLAGAIDTSAILDSDGAMALFPCAGMTAFQCDFPNPEAEGASGEKGYLEDVCLGGGLADTSLATWVAILQGSRDEPSYRYARVDLVLDAETGLPVGPKLSQANTANAWMSVALAERDSVMPSAYLVGVRAVQGPDSLLGTDGRAWTWAYDFYDQGTNNSFVIDRITGGQIASSRTFHGLPKELVDVGGSPFLFYDLDGLYDSDAALDTLLAHGFQDYLDSDCTARVESATLLALDLFAGWSSYPGWLFVSGSPCDTTEQFFSIVMGDGTYGGTVPAAAFDHGTTAKGDLARAEAAAQNVYGTPTLLGITQGFANPSGVAGNWGYVFVENGARGGSGTMIFAEDESTYLAIPTSFPDNGVVPIDTSWIDSDSVLTVVLNDDDDGWLGECMSPTEYRMALRLDGGCPSELQWYVEARHGDVCPGRPAKVWIVDALTGDVCSQAIGVTLSDIGFDPSPGAVLVRWAAGDRFAYATFVVERSPDENGPWTEIHRVRGRPDGPQRWVDTDVHAGTYYYRLVIESSGSRDVAGPYRVIVPGVALPTAFALRTGFPNPANPSTSVAFDVPAPGRVTIRVFNLFGQVVSTLVDGAVPPGRHEATWHGADADGRPVASGVYFVRMEADGFRQTRKITLLR